MDILKLAEMFEQIHIAKANFVGEIGESIFAQIARKYLSNDYYIIVNSVLKAKNGTTQIDQIIVSKFGIFVVEIKTYQGWIWGNANNMQWTQTLPSGNYQFQNPLRQNYKHLKTLQELLTYPNHFFKSLIVFSAQAEFKTVLPNNVVNNANAYIAFIKSYQTVLMTDEQVQFTLNKILENTLSQTEHQAHLQKIKDQCNNAEENNPPQCPRCGNNMVLRKAKTGNHIGRAFWGCKNYPQCKAIMNIKPGKEKVFEKLREIENLFNQFFK
jgi:restriction system protein